MKGLEFWFRSLATHLSTSSSSSTTTTDSGVYYSVIVVGTFLDHLSVNKTEKNLRAQHVDALARECGLVVPSLQYFEVSCSSSLDNIAQVQEAIFKTALSHSYMGERVPKSYLAIEGFIKKHRIEQSEMPIIPID